MTKELQTLPTSFRRRCQNVMFDWLTDGWFGLLVGSNSSNVGTRIGLRSDNLCRASYRTKQWPKYKKKRCNGKPLLKLDEEVRVVCRQFLIFS